MMRQLSEVELINYIENVAKSLEKDHSHCAGKKIKHRIYFSVMERINDLILECECLKNSVTVDLNGFDSYLTKINLLKDKWIKSVPKITLLKGKDQYEGIN